MEKCSENRTAYLEGNRLEFDSVFVHRLVFPTRSRTGPKWDPLTFPSFKVLTRGVSLSHAPQAARANSYRGRGFRPASKSKKPRARKRGFECSRRECTVVYHPAMAECGRATRTVVTTTLRPWSALSLRLLMNLGFSVVRWLHVLRKIT